MTDETTIKDLIVQTLKSEFPDYEVLDFPIILSDYNPINPEGEILVKPIGYRPTQYIDKNQQMNVLSFGNFVVIEYQVRLDLINQNFRTLNDILAITKTIVSKVMGIDLESNNIKAASQIMVLDVGEPLYEEQKQFQYRSMIFTLPVMTDLGD